MPEEGVPEYGWVVTLIKGNDIQVHYFDLEDETDAEILYDVGHAQMELAFMAKVVKGQFPKGVVNRKFKVQEA